MFNLSVMVRRHTRRGVKRHYSCVLVGSPSARPGTRDPPAPPAAARFHGYGILIQL